MTNSGRSRARQVQLRNGFYIEICSKGQKKGVKIRSANKTEMEDTASMYRGYKDVIILGEYRDGSPCNERC
jgi:hypothetical protein